ncbi:MAG: hypothetical protein R3D33_12180 [Hyphomicrobiaceae bacterium]
MTLEQWLSYLFGDGFWGGQGLVWLVGGVAAIAALTILFLAMRERPARKARPGGEARPDGEVAERPAREGPRSSADRQERGADVVAAGREADTPSSAPRTDDEAPDREATGSDGEGGRMARPDAGGLLALARQEHVAGRPVLAARALEDLLDLAGRTSAAGDLEVAAGLIGEALKMAGALDLPASAAAARIAFADLSVARGDLTSACEHWQLARELLRRTGQWSAADEIDRAMHRSGCPTDWVLNAI